MLFTTVYSKFMIEKMSAKR